MVSLMARSGWNGAVYGIVGIVSHVSKSGSEFRILGNPKRFRPMGTIEQIRGTFHPILLGQTIRLVLNSMGAVVWFEVLPPTQAQIDGLASEMHLRRLRKQSLLRTV